MTDARRRTTDAGGRLARLLSAVCALTTVTVAPAAAQRIPTFDVATSCRQAASRAAPIGSVDGCLRIEQNAREELTRQWATFAPADKSHCIGLSTLGGEPTYTELLSCLEVAREAKNAAQGRERTTGQGAR